MLKFSFYTSENGIFVASNDRDYLGKRERIRGNIKINGVVPEETNHPLWKFVKGADSIASVELLGSPTAVNFRWELREDAPAPIKALTPQTLLSSEVTESFDDDDYTWSLMNNEYAPFYKRTHDFAPAEYSNVAFEATHLGEVKEVLVEHPKKVMYNVYKTQWKHQGATSLDLSAIVAYEELNEILVPEITLHNTPCSLSTEQTYKIIRKYVDENINPKFAKITSDYDFCFSVSQRISIKPYKRTVEQKKANGKSYSRPKYNEYDIKEKTFEVFRMAPKPYQSYPVVKAFKGESLADLIENIELFLRELMDVINTPMAECEQCSGTGHICKKMDV